MSNQNMIALKSARIVILFLIAFLSSRSVFALEIKYSNVSPFGGGPIAGEYLILKGEITPGDYDHLLNVIWNNPSRFFRESGGGISQPIIVLASPGGDIQEAIKIARLVKGVYADVWVGEVTGACASACFFIFASGAYRLATPGTVGIHRPYVHPRRLASLSPSQAEALQNDLFGQARSYLQELQIPTSIIDTMFQRASSEVYWLSYAELWKQIGVRPPWYEQFMIGRCDLDKSVEQRYWSTGDKSLFNTDAEKCATWLIVPEAIGFLVNEFIKTGKNPTEAWDQFKPRK
jgi:hypothetical protein